MLQNKYGIYSQADSWVVNYLILIQEKRDDMKDNNDDDDELRIRSRPLMMKDFVNLDICITKSIRYMEEHPQTKEFLYEVINAAAAQCCEYAYELGFEDPNEIISENVFSFEYRQK